MTLSPSAATVPEIRELDTADAAILAILEQQLFPEGAWSASMLQQELSQPDRHYIAVLDGAQIVGYSGIWLGDPAQVMTVGVVETHRRRGFARLMMENLVAVAQRADAARVLLEVRESNAAAQSMYRMLGFNSIATRPHYYGDEAAVVMELPLLERNQ